MFFRTPLGQNTETIYSTLLVSSNTTLTEDAEYGYIRVLAGATLTVNAGVTLQAGDIVCDGSLVNNGQIEVSTANDSRMGATDSAGVFKTSRETAVVNDLSTSDSAGVFKDKRKTTVINTYPS